MMNFKFAAPTVFSAALMAGAAAVHAAPVDMTVTFDDEPYVIAPFSFDEDSPGVVNDSKCNGSESMKPCLKVNTQGPAELSIVASMTFSIKSFWFLLIGKGDDMLVTTDKGSLSLLDAVYGHNDDGQVADVSGNPFFQGIKWVQFIMSCPPDDDKKKNGPACAGTGLIDDIKLTYDDGKTPPSPVPLPAGGALLLGGLAGLAALRRRKAA